MCRGDAGDRRLLDAPNCRCPPLLPPDGEVIAAFREPNGTGETARGDSGNAHGDDDRCVAAGDRKGGVRKLNFDTIGCDGDVGRLRRL